MTSEIVGMLFGSVFGITIWWFLRNFEGGAMTTRVRGLAWLSMICGVLLLFMTIYRLIRGV